MIDLRKKIEAALVGQFERPGLAWVEEKNWQKKGGYTTFREINNVLDLFDLEQESDKKIRLTFTSLKDQWLWHHEVSKFDYRSNGNTEVLLFDEGGVFLESKETPAWCNCQAKSSEDHQRAIEEGDALLFLLEERSDWKVALIINVDDTDQSLEYRMAVR
jgi:hypothetical protein